MSATMVERKYVMTRLGSGSYLLPSNDGQTMWWIYRFEDGKSHGLEGEPDRMYWACAKYRGTMEAAIRTVERNMEDYGYIEMGNWYETATYLRTRQDAIAAALKT